MKRYFQNLLVLGICTFLLSNNSVFASNITLGSNYRNLVGGHGLLANLTAGDTIFMLPGVYQNLRMVNIKGTKNSPIVITNHPSGKVSIISNHYYGISVNSCEYIHLTGTGADSIQYGFEIDGVRGNGIGAGKGSFGVEIDHIEIRNVRAAAIQVKTDATCTAYDRSAITLYDIDIHHNRIENPGTEGLYIGNSNFRPKQRTCNGQTVILRNPMMENVKIHHNEVLYAGWDGIQVSSARNVEVYDNYVAYDSQKEKHGHMSGIFIGGGATAKVYNNLIENGKGNGISCFGLGAQEFYNNIIIKPGLNAPAHLYIFGIYVHDKEDTLLNASSTIAHNLIIKPKRGIKLHLKKASNNLDKVYNNFIVEPLEYAHYNAYNQPTKAFIQTPLNPVSYSGNVHAVTIDYTWFQDFANGDFRPTSTSGVINAGTTISGSPVLLDADGNSRIQGAAPDAGPYESSITGSNKTIGYDNLGVPSLHISSSESDLMVSANGFETGNVAVKLYSLTGRFITEWQRQSSGFSDLFRLDLPNQLQPGMFIAIAEQNGTTATEKIYLR